MEKQKLIAKLNIKDYSKELENILVNKPFPKTAKNLLLSMFYKIENSYEDYKKVKVEVPNKKDFLQELLNIVDEDCQDIEIIKPKLENDIVEDRKSITIKEEKKIITYQNEVAILEELYKLNSKKFDIKMENTIASKAFSNLLNEGEVIDRSEVIRDFDGWSWNTLEDENKYNISKLVYIGMTYLIGYDILNYNKKVDICVLENILKEKYKTALTEKIIKTVTQIAVLQYVKVNPEEKNILLKTKENLEKQLEFINDKKKYIQNITNDKKRCIKEIEKIDKYINDDLLLKKEYIRQNEALPQEERVFSLSDFSEKVQSQKDNMQKQIEELTEKMKPKNYVKEKTKIEKEFEFISEMDFENSNINVFVGEFINLMLKALGMQINSITLKKDIIEKIYILRYLNLLNLNERSSIGEEHGKQIDKVQKKLITKGCNLKNLTIFSQDVEENYTIYKNIFTTKIIDLESTCIEITKDNIVKIYDENSIEKEEKHNKFNDLIIKYNKRMKIFL